MNRGATDGHHEGGIVLVHAMILIAVIAVLAAAAIQRGSALAMDNMRERAQLRALHAAEGGLAHARHALRKNAGFAGNEIEIGGCVVLVSVRRQRDDQWEITARATCQTRGRQSVRVGVSEGYGAVYWYRALR